MGCAVWPTCGSARLNHRIVSYVCAPLRKRVLPQSREGESRRDCSRFVPCNSSGKRERSISGRDGGGNNKKKKRLRTFPSQARLVSLRRWPTSARIRNAQGSQHSSAQQCAVSFECSEPMNVKTNRLSAAKADGCRCILSQIFKRGWNRRLNTPSLSVEFCLCWR
jgi:hypothetical protein